MLQRSAAACFSYMMYLDPGTGAFVTSQCFERRYRISIEAWMSSSLSSLAGRPDGSQDVDTNMLGHVVDPARNR